MQMTEQVGWIDKVEVGAAPAGRFWRRILWSALGFWVLAAPVAAEVRITALARDGQPVAATTDVVCTRFASFQAEPEVATGMALETGDLLASVSGATDLELTCPNGSLLRFSGSFRVLIDVPEEGSDCAVNFLSGTLDVLTDQPTEVNAGGIVLGTEGTEYTVEAVRGEEGIDQRCMVYDGRIRWRSREVEESWLEPGTRLDVAGGRMSEGRISATQLRRTASRFARFDVAKSQINGRQISDPGVARERLEALHYEVLSRPADNARRLELARVQQDLEVGERAAYNLYRAGERTTAAASRDPFELLAEEQYPEAVELFEQRVRLPDVSARDFCGLARARFALEGRTRTVVSWAERAMRRASDGSLPRRELELCRGLAEND